MRQKKIKLYFNARISRLLARVSLVFIFYLSVCQLSLSQNVENLVTKDSTRLIPENEALATEENKGTILSASTVKDTVNEVLMFNKAKSLMFDDSVIDNIENALDSFKNNTSFSLDGAESNDANSTGKAAEDRKSLIYLSSIVYFSPNSWAVWINDEKITSRDNSENKDIYLKLVKQNYVKVIWKISFSKWKILLGSKSPNQSPKVINNKVEVEFVLRPNQTFVLSSGEVIGGQYAKGAVPNTKIETTKTTTDNNQINTDNKSDNATSSSPTITQEVPSATKSSNIFSGITNNIIKSPINPQ